MNLYLYAPNALRWVDPWGLSRYSSSGKYKPGTILGRTIYKNTVDIHPGVPKSVHPSIKSKVKDG
ncbi:TPA: hypothetical protein ACF3IV_004695 [Enterobacter hormaechei]